MEIYWELCPTMLFRLQCLTLNILLVESVPIAFMSVDTMGIGNILHFDLDGTWNFKDVE